MAGITIPNLPAAIALSGAELIEIVQNGTSYRTTLLQAAGAAAPSSANPVFFGVASSGSFVATETITGSMSAGAYSYGTLGYTDTNVFASFTSSVNSFNQIILQNTSGGNAASTDYIVSNNLGTATTYYGDFGMNSSAFSGTGSLNAANVVYLYSTSVDLVLGTTTSNSIRFVTNSSATDAAGIDASGNFTALVTGALSGSVQRTLKAKLGDFVSVKDFGAKGDGTTDDTAAINAALSALLYTGYTLYFPPGTYLVSQSGTDGTNGWCVYNPGVSMAGQGLIGAQIKAATSVVSTCDIMRVQPPNGGYIDFFHLDRISIQPTNGGTTYGRHGIFMNFGAGVTNCSKMLLENLYIYKCNGLSIYGYNNSTNAQGVPFAGVVRACALFSAVDFEYFADSLCFEGSNVIRDVNGNVGLKITAQTGLATGTAGGIQLNGLNIDASGGALYIRSGRGINIIGCDLEMTAGTCTNLVNLAGDVSTLVNVTWKGSTIGVLGTASVTNMINIGSVTLADLDGYTIVSAPTGSGFTQPVTGINITSSATTVNLGLGEITYNLTNQVADAGVGTRGVTRSLTANLASGITNVGSGYAPASCTMDKGGRVKLSGWLANASVTSGNPILTLPVGFRPPTNAVVYAGYGIVGGGAAEIRFDLFANGVVQYAAVGTATQISLDNIVFDTQSWVTGNA
jgi:hypothetical protein